MLNVIDLNEKENKLAEDCANFEINKVEYNDKKVGFITSGIPYQYVKEVFPTADVLKLGLVNPLPKKLIEDFPPDSVIYQKLNDIMELKHKKE